MCTCRHLFNTIQVRNQALTVTYKATSSADSLPELCSTCTSDHESDSSFEEPANSSKTLVGAIDELGEKVAELAKSYSLKGAVYNMDQKGILVGGSARKKTMGSTSGKD